MSNTYFRFKQFSVNQDRCAMKVTTDGCLFGAWVAATVKQDTATVGHCLDIGTGTGLLSLMLAQQNNCSIHALEIDENAAAQAAENIAASPWKKQIKIEQGDATKFSTDISYDLIISNPPFYENELKGPVDSKNRAHHDNSLSLSQLLLTIKKNLAEDGNFYLLLPFKRNREIRKLLTEQELEIRQLCFVKQSVSHDYFRLMLKGGRYKGPGQAIIAEEIFIKDEKNNYSGTFTKLLKDYYLYL